MSADKLVDSTLLDAACTYEAGKIREKLGSSAQIAYDLANGKGFGDAIAAIPTGGGGVTAETGTITLASDFGLSTSPQNIPGLQLSFQPDFFYIVITRDSYEAKTSPGTGLWAMLAAKRTFFPPGAASGSATPETATADYTFMTVTGSTANSSITGGYGIGTMGYLGASYYSRFSVNANGTISVGRWSSASTYMKAGTYRYFAVKI